MVRMRKRVERRPDGGREGGRAAHLCVARINSHMQRRLARGELMGLQRGGRHELLDGLELFSAHGGEEVDLLHIGIEG